MKPNALKYISLQQLDALVYLLSEGNFSRAAKKMNLSQPSLTKHIRNMEDALETLVVNREKTGVTLTPEGRVVYDFARKIFKWREETVEKIARVHENEAGTIAIAASTIPATYILPHILSRFRVTCPQVQVFVHTADSQEVQDLILNGEREIGIIGKMPPHGKLEAESLWEDQLVLAVPADHRWTAEQPVSIAELAAEPFVIREKGSGTRDILERYMKEQAGVDLAAFNIIAELGSSEAIKEAVLAGLGVSILSIRAIKRELDRGMLREIPIADWRIKRSFYVIFRRQLNFLRHHHLFLDFIRHFSLDNPGSR